MSSAGGRGKSKVVAGVLGLLLGGFGVHQFYLGSVGTGIVIILLNCICVRQRLTLLSKMESKSAANGQVAPCSP